MAGGAQAALAAGVSERMATSGWRATGRVANWPCMIGTRRRCDHRTHPGCGHHPDRGTAAQRLSGRRIARRLGLPVSTVGAVCVAAARLLKQLDERPEVVRYERAKPGELIHIDTRSSAASTASATASPATEPDASAGLAGTPPRRHRRRSRLAYTELLPAETGEACAGFLARASQWFAANGVTVRRVMTDNAFAYTTAAPTRPHWRRWARATSPPDPTGREPTARPSASSRPPARMALRQALCSIRRARCRHAKLAALVQSPQAALSPRGKPPAFRLNKVLGNDT